MRATLLTLTLCLVAFAPEFAGAQYQPQYRSALSVSFAIA